MKGYDGFQARKNESGFISVPPVGVYEGVIQKARYVVADGNWDHDRIELFTDITEGEYKGRYMALFNDQKERFGDGASYKGLVTLVLPTNSDEDWKKRSFEHNVWAIQDSNVDFRFDWDRLPNVDNFNGKKICLNVRQRLYTYNGQDRETTEIARLESVKEFKAGKVRTMRPNDRRSEESKQAEASTDGSAFTDVSATVSVPW